MKQMPINQELLDQIRANLGPALPVSLTAGSEGFDLYEAYIFSLVLRAGLMEGATVSFANRSGANLTSFTFRTSPGQIFHPAAGNPTDFSHAIIAFNGKPELEAHVGVRTSGSSTVLHECDVSVLQRDEAVLCRANKTAPRGSKVIILAECKFYAGTIPLDMARGFLGLTTDFSRVNMFFVINNSSKSVELLLSKRKKGLATQVVPANNNQRDLIISLFRDKFLRFKYTH